MIADRVIETRGGRGRADDEGRTLRRTLGVASLGGATLDNEENYLHQEAVSPRLGLVTGREPGPDMTLVHGPRSGDLVRSGRGHHLPAGSAARRLHPDHGLEHGRMPSGRVPVGDGGRRPRRRGRPRRSPLHPDQRRRRPRMSASGPGRTSPSSAALVNYILEHGREFREYVGAYTNAAVIIDEGFQDTEDLDGFFSGWRRGRPHLRHDDVAVRRDGGARLGRPARIGRGHGRAGSRRPRRAPASWRTPRAGPVAAASSLRLPAAQAALPRGTRPSSSPTVRRARKRVPDGRRGAVQQLGARTDVGDLLRGRLDAAHRRRADTSAPRRSSSCCWATSAAPAAASSRCAATRPSRARPTSRRCTTSSPATSRCRTRTRTTSLARFIEPNTAPSGFWGNMQAYTRQPAQGVVGRRGHGGQRLLLRLPAADHRRPLDLPAVLGHARRRGQGLFVWARTRRWARPTRAAPPGAGPARLAGRARPGRDRDGDVLERRARGRSRRAAYAGHRHRGVLPARGRAHREGRAASPTPSGCCSGTTKRSSRRATAAPSCGSTYTSGGSSGRSWRPRPIRGPAGARSAVGLPDVRRHGRARAPTQCCARSTAGARTARRCRRTRS